MQARRRARAHTARDITYLHQYSSVNSIAQTTAWQLQRTNIRVNAICPGLVETAMTAPVFDYARQRGSIDKMGQVNPMGRYGVPEGNFVLYPLYSKLGC